MVAYGFVRERINKVILEGIYLFPIGFRPFLVSLLLDRTFFTDIAVLKKMKKAKKENRVLLLEPNSHHGETLPGYINYLNRLGYDVDLIVPPRLYRENPFSGIHTKSGLRIFPMSFLIMKRALLLCNISDYKAFFVSSSAFSDWPERGKAPFVLDVFDEIPREKVCVVEHHTDNISQYREEDLVRRGQLTALWEREFDGQTLALCNPHYFGKTKDHTRRSHTTFLSVGALSKNRRNYDELVEATQKLVRNGMRNFSVVIAGGGKPFPVPAHMQRYFRFEGRVDFPKLYRLVEEADFLLTLLDPEIVAHRRYLTKSVTGTTQLSFGFLKPCIIQQEFADAYKLAGSDSVLFTESLSSGLEKAMAVCPTRYSKLRKNLSEKQTTIYKKSLDSISKVFEVIAK